MASNSWHFQKTHEKLCSLLLLYNMWHQQSGPSEAASRSLWTCSWCINLKFFKDIVQLWGGLNIFRLARPINLRDHETKLITYEWGKTSAMYHFSTHKTFLSFEFCSGSLVISCPSPSARVREITLEPLQNSQDKNNLFVEKWYIASVFTPLIGKWLITFIFIFCRCLHCFFYSEVIKP